MITYFYIGVFLALICTTMLKYNFEELKQYLSYDEQNLLSKSPNLFIGILFIMITLCWPLILVDIIRKL